MSGARMDLTFDAGQARSFLRGLADAAADLDPVRRDFADYMVTSVKRNFEAGGRPRRWDPSRRAVLKGGQTLLKTGRLRRSIMGLVSGETVLVGSNLVYAGAHQFGVAKQVVQQVRSHSRKVKPRAKGQASYVIVRAHARSVRLSLPARPFLVVQREDKAYLNRSLLRHLGAAQGKDWRFGR